MQNTVETNDNILCYLNDWEVGKSNSPRTKGESYSFRFAVVAMTHCWGLVEYREDSVPLYHKYATSFADLCVFFRLNANIAIHEGMNLVATSLQKIDTSVPAIGLLPAKASVEEVLDFAKKIDVLYKTDYALHNDVRKRLFKTSDEE